MAERRLDVALATCARLPEPDPDAEPLAAAMRAAELNFVEVAWDAPPALAVSPRMTILRSTWNYPDHPEEFSSWAKSVARTSDLWNPLPVVQWNLHKRYLIALADMGIPVVPTQLVPQGSATSLHAVVTARGWHDVVIKPAISAASKDTERAGAGTEQASAHYDALLARGDVLVQPYLPSVDGYGERAVIWIDGEVTHAVRKSRRLAGDAECVTAAHVSPAEATLARRTIDAVRTLLATDLLYARVDLAPDAHGDPLVMELELVEPSLFFTQGPRALDRFVAGVQRRLAAAR